MESVLGSNWLKRYKYPQARKKFRQAWAFNSVSDLWEDEVTFAKNLRQLEDGFNGTFYPKNISTFSITVPSRLFCVNY